MPFWSNLFKTTDPMPRPRIVPEQEALDAALLLFWQKGYDRTSIAELGEVIGVGPSSLYNSFGSKSALFRKALERYLATHTGFVQHSIDAAPGRDLESSLRELLREAVQLYTKRGLPRGCALLQAGGSGGSEDSEGAAIAREFRHGLELALRDLFARSPGADQLTDTPRLLAKALLGTLRGLSQLAADGTRRADLLLVAEHSIRAFVRSA